MASPSGSRGRDLGLPQLPPHVEAQAVERQEVIRDHLAIGDRDIERELELVDQADQEYGVEDTELKQVVLEVDGDILVDHLGEQRAELPLQTIFGHWRVHR